MVLGREVSGGGGGSRLQQQEEARLRDWIQEMRHERRRLEDKLLMGDSHVSVRDVTLGDGRSRGDKRSGVGRSGDGRQDVDHVWGQSQARGGALFRPVLS